MTCSDLKRFEAYEETAKLFPGIIHEVFDIMKGPSVKKHDAILCLGMIYLFDEPGLDRFFKNVAGSLVSGGDLILDSSGPPDNLFVRAFHGGFLNFEARLKKLVWRIWRGVWPAIVTKHHGFFRSDEDIVGAARRHGFDLLDRKVFSFLTEFRRSSILCRLIDRSRMAEKVFSFLGRKFPYVRMFHFREASKG